MRRHCMDIFHFFANELKDTPLFTSNRINLFEPRVGAVFNDYEYDQSIEGGEMCASQPLSQYAGPSKHCELYKVWTVMGPVSILVGPPMLSVVVL